MKNIQHTIKKSEDISENIDRSGKSEYSVTVRSIKGVRLLSRPGLSGIKTKKEYLCYPGISFKLPIDIYR